MGYRRDIKERNLNGEEVRRASKYRKKRNKIVHLKTIVFLRSINNVNVKRMYIKHIE